MRGRGVGQRGRAHAASDHVSDALARGAARVPAGRGARAGHSRPLCRARTFLGCPRASERERLGSGRRGRREVGRRGRVVAEAQRGLLAAAVGHRGARRARRAPPGARRWQPRSGKGAPSGEGRVRMEGAAAAARGARGVGLPAPQPPVPMHFCKR